MAPKAGGDSAKVNSAVYKDKSKPTDIRLSNINAAKAVSDAIRTSLGPRGMDKMIQASNGEVTITNDGATILKQMSVIHPAAKMLVELSRAQDIEAGDGTTSVVVIAGALLDASEKLLQKGIHPTVISDGFQKALQIALQVVEGMSTPVDLTNEDALLKAAATSLNSKVVSQHSTILAPIAVQAIRAVMEPIEGGVGARVDLRDVKVIERIGGTVEDAELVQGLVIPHRAANVNGPHRVEKAKVGLIQFCISPPKTDMDHNVIVSDYAAMDRVLKEERQYILNIVKQIKKAGCTVLLVQKSILRDALSDLAIHFLDKIKTMVIKDIEREDIEFVCKTLGCRPIASLDHFTAENLVNVDLVEEINEPGGKYIKMTGCSTGGRTVSVVVRGSSGAVVAEAGRSLHDALCAVRCVARRPALLAGGGAPEAAAAAALARAAIAAPGADHYTLRAYSDALEVVPSTLAENAGLNPIETVTELRAAHAAGAGGAGAGAGVNVRRGRVTDMRHEHVLQPLHVTASALALATETVRAILKIDDIVNTVN
ncbi:T-complex protein 1 subunit delta isoform X1 [Galleria mellonella]|uniref:T-complex protein 1 subunit delta n=2 Tax=Galleria mellonella TaxID=7137 RepID=A0ABM3MTW2_GALME|nr:T-complex protein 1 subunit delta isoform X1 [Galleria mellonella]